MQNKGQQIGGIMQRTDEMKDMVPFWMVYFQVENVDAAVERLLDLGGQVHHPVSEIPVGRFAIVADPQGGGV